MLEVTASETEKARIKVVPVDANGKPSKIQAGSLTVVPATTTGNAANPVVTMESDDTFTVQADLSPEGASANSFTEFDVTGDADVGEGVEPLTDRIKLNVSSSKATNLGLTSVEVVPR